MKSKSLIILIENYVSGGANKYTEDLLNSIEECFLNIEIWGNKEALASFNRNHLPERTKFKEIKIFNQSEKIKAFARPIRLILRVLLLPVTILINLVSFITIYMALENKRDTQILLCNGGYPASLFLVFSLLFIKKEHSPAMTIVSTPARKKMFPLDLIWKSIDSMVQKKTKVLIVNSLAIKNSLIKECSFAPDSIQIIRNGVLDQKLEKLDQGPMITIGFVSRVETTKGIQELLSAFKRLRMKYSNIELLIAGSGSGESEVVQASRQDSSIHYLGHVSPDQISSVFSRIKIFVLPSYQEGLPYSIIEACMANCVIVATNVGGIPEIIKHEENGLLIPPRNEEALFDAIEQLLSFPELQIKYAANARSTYLEEFSFEKMKEKARILCPER